MNRMTAMRGSLLKEPETKIFNQAAHEHLIAQGYLFSYHPADFDDGDSENGPGSWGHDAYNCYAGQEELVYVAANGTADHEAVDHDAKDFHRDQQAADKPFFYTVAIYLVDKRYGGPEEGGWYYDTGTRIDDPSDHGRFDAPAVFRNQAEAIAACTALNEALDVGANKGRPCISSVLSQGRYQAEVHDGYPPAHYPTERPHYE